MESEVFALIRDIVASGGVTDGTILLFIFIFAYLGYRYAIKPLSERLVDIPSKEELQNVVQSAIDENDLSLDDVSKKLEKLLEKLDDVEEFAKDNAKDVQDIKRDVEQIKQILNQFQGHLMYNHNPGSFGNRELK
jgi:vacuolar-type H+-ATPase subunit I/STV1